MSASALLRALAAITILAACRSTGPPPVAQLPPDTEGPPLRNSLRWTTASELENFGYDVYRSNCPEGPFERITPRPIPGAGTSDLPREYRFVDENIQPSKAYYYYVESISLGGQRERFTPVIRAAAKRPGDEPTGEACEPAPERTPPG